MNALDLDTSTYAIADVFASKAFILDQIYLA